MSELQPVPFTSIVYNSLSPDFSNFLVHTYPSFFAALFEKYQTIYGFDPIYILKKQFYHKKKNLDPNSSASPFKKSQCKMSQDIHETYKNFFEFQHSNISNWKIILKNEKVEIFRMQMENSPCWVIKSKAKLENISANQVFEAIYDINIRKKWDFVFDKFEQIKRINDNLDVIYFSISVPFPLITPRDFVQRRHFIKHFPSYNQTVIQFKSIEIPEVPHHSEKIRGETIVSAYLITALNKNNCELEFVSMVDIKGEVPKFIYNLVATKAPMSWIENLKNYCLGKPLKKNFF